MTAGTVDASRVRELTSALAEKRQEIKGLADSWKTEDGGKFVISTQEHKTYLKAVADAQEIKSLLDAEQAVGAIDAFLDAPAGAAPTAADLGANRGPQVKSLGQAWLESDAYLEMKQSGFRRFGQQFQVEQSLHSLNGLQAKDIYSAMGGNVAIPALGTAQNLGWTERMLRPGRVRDLFPAERTNSAILYGMRETGFTNNAAVVPERTADNTNFGLKPKSDLTVVPVTYPIATIAHVMYAHKNTLDDEPRLRGLIDRDMVDGVKMVEDYEILYGDGIGDNLTGLFNTSGVQTYTGVATDKRSAQIRRSITRAILAYFDPNGVVVHPLDWEEIELETDANGAYTVAVSVAIGGEKKVWRLKVVDTPAINQGEALVGAFGYGAKLYDREQVNIAVSTENKDLFERNAVTIRAEERVGLVVDRPESFVALTFTNPA